MLNMSLVRHSVTSRDSFKCSLKTFLFQLTRVHSALELFGQCDLQIYLLTYLLTYLLSTTSHRVICNILPSIKRQLVLCDAHDTSILIVDTYATIPVSPRSRYTAVYRSSTALSNAHFRYRGSIEYRDTWDGIVIVAPISRIAQH